MAGDTFEFPEVNKKNVVAYGVLNSIYRGAKNGTINALEGGLGDVIKGLLKGGLNADSKFYEALSGIKDGSLTSFLASSFIRYSESNHPLEPHFLAAQEVSNTLLSLKQYSELSDLNFEGISQVLKQQETLG